MLSGAVALSAIALESCFTGIESTPKVTANDVKRQNIVQRPEDTFLASISPEQFGEWKKGKQFYVSDNKFQLVLQPTPNKLNDYTGEFITYSGWNEMIDVTGNKVAEIEFADRAGNKLVYRSGLSADALSKEPGVHIPFLVEMSVVNSVRDKLQGNTYYVMTSSWYDTELKSRQGRKFVPVTVKSVKPGNAYYSTVLELTDENGAPFCLLLSAGNDLKSLRSFGSIFSFTDPHKSYPNISDDHWKKIIAGRVAPGMTRDECRLSLGAPANVDRSAGYSSLREIWSYENGAYLIFIDGLLDSFRI